MKVLAIFMACVSAVALMSCGGNQGSKKEMMADSDSFPFDSSNLITTDSTRQQEEAEEEKPKPQMAFADTEKAMDYMRNSGHWDKYQSGILPRMADENLEYAGKLLNNDHKYFIVVDKAVMKVFLYSKYGEVVKEYGMACAKRYGTKHKKADSRTPEGYFTVSGIYDSTDWLFTDDNGRTSKKKGQFGPRFIRLNTPVSSQIGIHGTCAPWSIGGRVSHGCIRVTNENIMELVKYAEVGMPVIVSPGPRDMRVNEDEGYKIAAVTTGDTPVKATEKRKETKKKEAQEASENDSTATEEKAEQAPAEKSPAEETPAPQEEKSAPAGGGSEQ